MTAQSLCDIYLAENPDDAPLLLDNATTGCTDGHAKRCVRSAVPSLRGAPSSWPTTTPGPPTDPQPAREEGQASTGDGFTNFEHCRVRDLIDAGVLRGQSHLACESASLLADGSLGTAQMLSARTISG